VNKWLSVYIEKRLKELKKYHSKVRDCQNCPMVSYVEDLYKLILKVK